jgi:hypothetical protein
LKIQFYAITQTITQYASFSTLKILFAM